MTWSDIKLELGKKLNDPSGSKFGGVLKNYFRSAYNDYVPKAPLEQLYLLQNEEEIGLAGMRGEYSIPASCLFINISPSIGNTSRTIKRFIKVTETDYYLSTSNSIMRPTSSEVKWFKDNNIIQLLSDSPSVAFRFNYLPELDFDKIDTYISTDAIASIMNMVIDRLIPKKAKDEYTNTDK